MLLRTHPPQMRYLAAAALLVLGGKEVTADAVKAVLTAAGAEVDEERVTLLLKELEGKDIHELLAKGEKDLKSVVGVAAAPAAGAGAGAAPKAAAVSLSSPSPFASRRLSLPLPSPSLLFLRSPRFRCQLTCSPTPTPNPPPTQAPEKPKEEEVDALDGGMDMFGGGGKKGGGDY